MSTRRVLSAVLVAAFLSVAPAPGAVGSCEGDASGEPADFRDYCEQREQLVCVRRFLRREITERERDLCRWEAIDTCQRRAFPPDCQPTRREAQTCLNALSSLDTLHTQESELRDCSLQALCDLPRSAADEAAGDAGAAP
jgi:hypothetical protein